MHSSLQMHQSEDRAGSDSSTGSEGSLWLHKHYICSVMFSLFLRGCFIGFLDVGRKCITF